MASPYSERAIAEALHYGKALLKFISPNDVGMTGGHQCGYYMPKTIWPHLTDLQPIKDTQGDRHLTITWQDGRETASRLVWYGQKTRNEFRITRFGRDFPWLTYDNVGDLLVLIPIGKHEFIAYVLDLEDDIEEIQAALGIEFTDTIALYLAKVITLETPGACISREFGKFIKSLNDFPRSKEFSLAAWHALQSCISNFKNKSLDDQLLECLEAEYTLFRMAERLLCQNQLVRLFKSVDEFLTIANTIMNRRKSRAGLSLQNHLELLLKDAGLPFATNLPIKSKPDMVFPSLSAYNDPKWPDEKIFILAIKTTCKDRWRQVLQEAPRIQTKFLLTTQKGISINQLQQMKDAGITLVVPAGLHRHYPPKNKLPTPILTVAQFVNKVHQTLYSND